MPRTKQKGGREGGRVPLTGRPGNEKKSRNDAFDRRGGGRGDFTLRGRPGETKKKEKGTGRRALPVFPGKERKKGGEVLQARDKGKEKKEGGGGGNARPVRSSHAHREEKKRKKKKKKKIVPSTCP